MRIRLRGAGFRERRPYVGPPLTGMSHVSYMYGMVDGTSHQKTSDKTREWVLLADKSRFAKVVDVAFTDIVRNALPTLALSREIDWGGSIMPLGDISYGVKSQLIVIAGILTIVRRRDVLRPIAVPLVQQCQLIL